MLIDSIAYLRLLRHPWPCSQPPDFHKSNKALLSRFGKNKSAAEGKALDFTPQIWFLSGSHIMDYRTRYHQLVGFDKWLLWLTLAWSILGIVSNYVRVHTDNNLLNVILQLAVMALWLMIAVTIIRSITNSDRLLRDYGFSFRLGGLISLAVVIAFSAYKIAEQQVGTELIDSEFIFKVTGAFMEEIVFRAVAINIFISYFDGIKGKLFWAILASTIIWTVPHIPSKTPIEWEWLFVSSIISGYIYRWSRSVLLPAWLHVASNTSWFGGLIACIAYLLIAVFDFPILARRSHRSRPLAT